MGIGVGDPTKMTTSYWEAYDRVQQPFKETEERRRREAEQRRQDYKELIDELPTFEGLSGQATEELNADVQRARDLYQKRMEAGPFFSLMRTETGQKAQEELGQLEKDITRKKSQYDYVLQNVQPQMQFMANPANQDKLNQQRSRENVAAFNQMSLDEKRDFVASGQPLAVMKPEPQDYFGFVGDVMDRAKEFGTLTQDATYGVDPATGLYTIQTTEEYDPPSLHQHAVTAYRQADPAMRDYIDEVYDDAPEASKIADDGTPLSKEDWFGNQLSGLFGKRTKVSAQKAPTTRTTGDKQAYNPGTSRTETGEIDTTTTQRETTMAVPVEMTVTKPRAPKVFGPERGKPRWEEEGKTEAVSEEQTFDTRVLPLTGFDDDYTTVVRQSSVDTSTGVPPPRGKATANTAVGVMFAPTWQGKRTPVTVDDPEEKDKDKVSRTYYLEPGKPIPKNLTAELDKQGIPYNWGAYLVEQSVYGAALEEIKLAPGVSMTDYISKNGKTVMTNWDEARPELYGIMNQKGYDINQIEADVNDMLNELNNVDEIYTTPAPNASRESAYERVTGR